MATLGGRAIGVSRFPSPSSSSYFGGRNVRATTSSTLSFSMQMAATKSLTSHGTTVSCSAVQESSSSSSPSTVTSDKEEEEEEVKTAPKAAPAAKPKPKPKPAAKAAAKPLPQMMEEDIIPGLKTFLEAKDGISEVDLSFQDNKLEGFFKKNGLPYTFWAFFPDGNLTGVKGFSLSCYGSEASTVEPFLIDEKKITARHVMFWVEKRLAAQGIIPVWDA